MSSFSRATAVHRSLNSQTVQWSLSVSAGGFPSICFISSLRTRRASVMTAVTPAGVLKLTLDVFLLRP